MMKNPRPNAQVIQDHLAGLNRVSDACIISADSARAIAIGVNNYLQWFRDHDIAVRQHSKTGKWIEVPSNA